MPLNWERDAPLTVKNVPAVPSGPTKVKGPATLLLPAASNTAPGRTTTDDRTFQAPWSLLGTPSITLPTGLSVAGLPFGSQLVARRGAVAALEARLSAHRRVLRLLLSRIAPEDREDVLALMAEPYPPQDGQEDPGAVPVEEFAAIAAYGAEMRVLREAVK